MKLQAERCPMHAHLPIAAPQVAEPACLDFLKRAGGPECGPGKGGPTCGDRVATFILCEWRVG